MNLDFLKGVFDGQALTFEDFKNAVNKDESIKIANLADGGYVSKDKYSNLENNVSEYQKKIESLQNSVEDIKTLKEKISTLSTEYEDKIKDMQMDTALKMAVNNEAYDTDIVLSLVDKSILKVQNDGSVIGLDEQINTLKKDKPFLFKSSTEKKTGYQPTNGDKPETKNPWKKETFNLTEQGKILKEDPVRAQELASAAGLNLNGGRY